MAKHELTQSEKVTLVATLDAHNREYFDQEFFQELMSCDIPRPDEMDDRIRRATQKFIDILTASMKKGSPPLEETTVVVIKAGLMQSLLVGYELGRKLQRPLTANETMPK
jgi:hypothetical protein